MKSLFGETYVAPKTPLTPLLILRALFNGGVQWAGEAIVGLIPLIAYGLTHGFGKDPYITALCSPRVLKEAYASFSSYCTQYQPPPRDLCSFRCNFRIVASVNRAIRSRASTSAENGSYISNANSGDRVVARRWPFLRSDHGAFERRS
jgi:hypothetical protein